MPDVALPEDADQLRKELERYRLVVADLQGKIGKLEEELNAAATMAEVPTVVVTQPELRQTLSRLIKKVAMIVQGEKVMLMLYNAEAGELAVLQPSLGISEEQAGELSLRPDQGITGLVYGSNKPVIYNDALADPRTEKDKEVALLRIRNGICVPLAIQQRDDEERVVDERVIGVMHVFNKRYEQDFNDDDVRLLEMLADQAAAVIANAQLYIELTEKKQELEETFESIHSGVIVISPRKVLRLINPAACRMLNLTETSYVGRPLNDVVLEPAIQELFNETSQNGKEMTREINLDGGRRIYQAETSMMGDENGETHSVVAIFNDITEIRQVERMKTAFVSTVSHELRTPLTSIKGFTATLIDDTDGIYDGETRMEFYHIIDTECDRLTRLITDLLNISRIESGRGIDIILSDVNLAELATQVTRSQQSYTDRHKVYSVIPSDFPLITADSDKITQILDNLVGNAVKYSPNGGDVTIAAEDEGSTIRIDISDQGLGIPEHHRDKIFQRFHMVDDDVDHKAVKGTGIGLYLVKHLAQAHGGDVWLLSSEVGKGSTFSVRLPKQPKVDEKATQAIGSG